MRHRSIVPAVLLAICATVVGSAQMAAQTPGSPINDLLGSAKAALNDLKFLRADTICRQVLALGPQLRRSQTVLAWQILAAAQFPEDGGARDTASARASLREAIRLDLDATLPLDIRWSGLETLRNEELRSTFGMAVRVPRAEIIYGGSAGDAIVRVATSIPSTVVLLARAQDGGTEIRIDSAVNTRDAALRVRALDGTTPILQSGAYEFIVRVRALTGGAVLERSLQASIVAPTLELQPPAAPLDTTKLLPELVKADRAQGIATGAVLGGFTIALSQTLRAGAPINALSADGRATLVGIVLAAGTIAAVWFDRGKILTKNRQANDRLKKDAAQRLADASNENTRRVTGYRARLTLLLEDK